MTTKVIRFFARYNQTVDEKMDAVIQTLTPEEWDKNLGGFFKSVRGVCSHVYIANFVWIQRFSALREFKVHKDVFFRDKYSFDQVLFPDIKDYLSGRAELDKKIIDFADELTEEDLQKTLTFRDSRGNLMEKIVSGAAMHFLNHATHHRGMISLYLELLGKDNDFASLLPLV